jgi:hypothetical protein
MGNRELMARETGAGQLRLKPKRSERANATLQLSQPAPQGVPELRIMYIRGRS